MHEPEAAGASLRWSRWGVLALAGALPLVDLGVVALVEPVPGLVAAVGVVLVLLPLHLWIVAHALRGATAPAAGRCLAAVAGLTALALVLVQTTWSFLLSSLAVSVLLVLPARWSVPGLGAVLALSWVEGASRHTAGEVQVSLYVVLVIASRAVCLYVIVRLVAQLDRLDAARAAVAVSAVEHARARTAVELTTSLAPDLELISRRASSLPPSHSTDELVQAVAGLADDCRRALAQVRQIVARTRDHAAQRALAAAGSILRGGPGPAPSPPHPHLRGDMGTRTGRALTLLVLVRVVLLAMLLFFVSGTGVDVQLPAWCLGAAVAVAVLELPLALRAALAPPSTDVSPGAVLVAGVVASTALVGTLLLRDPSPFLFAFAFVSSAAVMALRGRVRLAAVLGTVVVLCWAGHRGLSLSGPPPAQQLWYLLGYLPAVHLLAVGSLVASARLVSALIGLDATRTQLAEEAVDAENRRFARDLHDTLVQRLSAIALTADLVRQLLVRDPRAASAELVGLVELTDGLADEALQAGQDRREVTLAEEARTAVALLRAAGVRAEVRLPVTAPAPEVDTLLGWALREAATNVVRHSEATRCSIVVRADRDTTDLVITNDGARTSRPGPVPGNGLAGLGERVRAVSGSVSAELDEPGQFRLSVSVPARS